MCSNSAFLMHQLGNKLILKRGEMSRLETLSEEVLDNEQREEALEEEGVFISTFTYL